LSPSILPSPSSFSIANTERYTKELPGVMISMISLLAEEIIILSIQEALVVAARGAACFPPIVSIASIIDLFAFLDVSYSLR